MGIAARKMAAQDLASRKLIVILGSTATGKSKLGIELAKAFHGEVISADSMQVYKGLDVITNKVTAEESDGITHHLIDVVSPQEEFTVVDFKKQALEVIEDLSTNGKLPIVVGGTNYFIESLLWDFLIDDEDTAIVCSEEELQNRKSFNYNTKKCEHVHKTETDTQLVAENNENSESSLSLYEQLMQVDPERANQLHPNNVRKISRSLQIFHSTGKTHSKLMAEQKAQSGASGLSGPLRFPNSLVFWLTADQKVLDERISTRVNNMVGKGLLEEIKAFYENHVVKETNMESINRIIVGAENLQIESKDNKSEENVECTKDQIVKQTECESVKTDSVTSGNESLDTENRETKRKEIIECSNDYSVQCTNARKLCKSYEEGLFQAIGFKEFHPYLTYTGDEEKEREKLLLDSLERLKQITVRYSKKQKRWVRNRFLARPKENALSLYNLDATDLEEWGLNVLARAKEISRSFLDDLPIPYEALEPIETTVDVADKHRRHVCGICNDRVIIGDEAWIKHQQSRGHKKMKASSKQLTTIKQ